jgi:hypothetical protein
MVEWMIKKYGIGIVNVQGPHIASTAFADDNIPGEPVPDPVRRQRRDPSRRIISSGP